MITVHHELPREVLASPAGLMRDVRRDPSESRSARRGVPLGFLAACVPGVRGSPA
jgi:hypothetical protein